MARHIVQTKEWAEAKRAYGALVVEDAGVIYTKHKIPGLPYYYAYCPRVNPLEIDFEKLKASLKVNNCVGLTFDVPNILRGSEKEKSAEKILQKYCKKSTRSEFAKANVMLDISKSEKELFEGMVPKHRYNTRYASKNGVQVYVAETDHDFEDFFSLFRQTAHRQKYFIRPKEYYRQIWRVLGEKNICYILSAKKDEEVLASWMIFIYEDVLYYPYGGSSTNQRNLQASNALGWEVIRFGKEKGCNIFDMWGAAENPEDTNDSYFGFTNFKLKFGGVHVRYLDSYDLIINKPVYFLFVILNKIRWNLLEWGLIK